VTTGLDIGLEAAMVPFDMDATIRWMLEACRDAIRGAREDVNERGRSPKYSGRAGREN
jgi:hypothetical protein